MMAGISLADRTPVRVSAVTFMESVEMMALITETPEDASGALSELKRLEQSGWIDLTYYVLFDLDPAGKIHLEETSDPEERADIPGEAGLAAGLIGHLLHADPSRGSASKHTRSKVGTNGKRGSGGAGAALAT